MDLSLVDMSLLRSYGFSTLNICYEHATPMALVVKGAGIYFLILHNPSCDDV
jgi:hypothetical protein